MQNSQESSFGKGTADWAVNQALPGDPSKWGWRSNETPLLYIPGREVSRYLTDQSARACTHDHIRNDAVTAGKRH